MATPQAMFEPARLCTTGRPARSSAAAIIAAVVVLPLVAETSTEPASSSRDMRASARGDSLQQQAAGRGRAAGAPEAAACPPGASGRVRRDAEHQAGATDPQAAALDAHDRRGRADRVAVGVDDERAVGATSISSPRRNSVYPQSTCVPLKTFGSSRRKRSFADLLAEHHVELAVVELGHGEDVHAAAVDLRVADHHRVPANSWRSPSTVTVKVAGFQAASARSAA